MRDRKGDEEHNLTHDPRTYNDISNLISDLMKPVMRGEHTDRSQYISNEEHIGKYFCNIVFGVKPAYLLSHAYDVDEEGMRSKKRMFQQSVRIELYNLLKDVEIMKRKPEDLAKDPVLGEIERTYAAGTVEGVLYKLIRAAPNPETFRKIGEAVKKGADEYLKEKGTITQYKWSLFKEYNRILHELQQIKVG